MATDFLGNKLAFGDEVVFLNYNGTSADLEKGTITKIFSEQAEINGRKRRAEYKIIKLSTIDAVPVVRCKECKNAVDYYGDGGIYCRKKDEPIEWHGDNPDWFCADGEREFE